MGVMSRCEPLLKGIYVSICATIVPCGTPTACTPCIVTGDFGTSGPAELVSRQHLIHGRSVEQVPRLHCASAAGLRRWSIHEPCDRQRLSRPVRSQVPRPLAGIWYKCFRRQCAGKLSLAGPELIAVVNRCSADMPQAAKQANDQLSPTRQGCLSRQSAADSAVVRLGKLAALAGRSPTIAVLGTWRTYLGTVLLLYPQPSGQGHICVVFCRA